MSHQWRRAIEAHSYCTFEGPTSAELERVLTAEGKDCVHATH